MLKKFSIFLFSVVPALAWAQLSVLSTPGITNDTVAICIPQNANISYQATYTGAAFDSVVWALPGANPTSFSGLGPVSATYSNAGYFNSQVAVWSAGAIIAQESFVVDAADSIPQADFASSGSLVQFNNEDVYTICTPASSFTFFFQNRSKGYRSYSLDFGDGTPLQRGSNWDTTNHTYTQPGLYTVLLYTENGACGLDIDTLKLFFGNSPSGQINSVGNTNGLCLDPVSGTANMSFSFSNFGQNSAGTIYRVYFSDDNTTQTFTHPPPATITHTYTQASCGFNTPTYSNSFYVRFSVENPCGSTAPVFDPITLSSAPQADFEMPSDSCRGATISLFNISDPGSNLSYSPSLTNLAGGNGDYTCDSTTNSVWEISPNTYTIVQGNDGFRSSPSNPNTWIFGSDSLRVQFNQPGQYTVKMIISGSSLCDIDSLSQTICIDEPSAGNYTQSDSVICRGATVQLNYLENVSSTCDSTLLNWQIQPSTGWSLNAGSLSDTALDIQFTSSGLYRLIFQATRSCGITYDTSWIRVIGEPLVQLPSDTNICSITTLNLNDPARPIMVDDSLGTPSYTWTISPTTGWIFSGGTTANSLNPILDFQSFGTYQLILQQDNGCFSSSDTMQVGIHPIPALVVPNDTTLCAGDNFNYNLSAQQGTAPYSFSWQVQGAGLNTGANINLSNLQSDQKILIYLNDAQSCTDSGSFWIRVPQISTSITAPSTVCYNDSAQLSASISGGNGNLSFRWIGPNAAYLSDSTSLNPWVDSTGIPGTYILEVGDSLGCLVYDSINIGQFPFVQVDAGPDTLVCDALGLVDLNYAASPPGGSWTGNQVSANGLFNPSAAGIGLQRLYYQYQDANGCDYLDSVELTVTPAPTGNYSLSDTAGCSGMNFNASSASSASLSHFWYINDSLISTSLSTSFSLFNNSATTDEIYTLKLVVGQGGLNCTDTLEQLITIYPQPQAAFNIPDTVCAGDTLSLLSNSLIKGGLYDTLIWSTSPGLSLLNSHLPQSGVIIPDQQGAAAQNYDITLFVRSQDGCTDTLVQSFTVAPRPTANFALPPFACSPVILQASDSSSGQNLSYSWSIQPSVPILNANSAQPTFQIPPVNPDSLQYQIFLTVVDARGCIDTLSKYYTAYPAPIAALNIRNRDSCGPISANFSNLSASGQTGLDTSTMSFAWDFGNGLTSNSSTPGTRLFSNAGNTDTTYQIRLAVENAFGCRDTVWDSITVRAAPNASLITTGFSNCAPFFIDSTVVRAIEWAPQTTYQWTAFDTQGNLLPNSSFTGPKAFRYQINQPEDSIRLRLVVSRPHGCDPDTLEQWYYTLQSPVSAFGLSDSAGCSPLNITLSDSSIGAQSYAWYLDGLFFSAAANPSLSLQNNSSLNDTNYQIMLVVTASTGCKDTSFQTATVYGSSIADFSASTTCEGDTMFFSDLSQSLGTIIGWNWDFGDGQTDTLQNPYHLYTSLGPKVVSLTVTDDRGCSATYVDTVELHPFPVADFGKQGACEPLTWCLGQTINLLDSSTVAAAGAPITSWSWDMDQDGIEDYNVQNPSHVYSSAGFVQVRLIVETVYGCPDTAYKTFKVIDAPQSDFDFDTIPVCGPATVNLQNNSSGRIDSSRWNVYTLDGAGNRVYIFSDTTRAVAQSFNLVSGYGTDTTYYFELISYNCCAADTLRKSITMAPYPVAAFLPSTTVGCSPMPVTFQIDGLTTGNPDYVILDYGDGQIDTLYPSWFVNANGDSLRVLGQPTHTYINSLPTDTTFYVSLRAVNACGDSTLNDSILVRPGAVQAFLQADVIAGCEPLSVTFTDFSFGGTVTSWCLDWDTISGSCRQPVNTGSQITTTYTTAGTYVAAQFVNDGCSYDTAFQVITVSPSPVAGFGFTNFVCEGDSVFFNDQSTTNGAALNSYRWYFGDGDSSTLTNPVHIYDTSGVMEVVLIIGSVNGCPDTLTQSVTIFDQPEVNFGFSDACFNQQPIQFSDSSSVVSGSIVGTLWDFGDGATSTSLNPQHSYAAPGLYPVVLVKTSSNGCVDSIQQNVNVYPMPTAHFNYQRLSADSCSAPQLIQFNDLSSGAQGYYWDFDYVNNPGVHTSTIASPQFNFTNFGIYRVALIVSNAFGCTDTLFQDVSVRPSPNAGFSADRSSGCEPLMVQFTDTSQYSFPGGTIDSWTWDFGDGQSSSDPSPLHIYQEEGLYTPRLIVQTDGGCPDTIVGTEIEVFQTPIADFEMTKLTAREVEFKNRAGNLDSSTVVLWDFGDGSTAAEMDPVHRFNYDLTLGPKSVEVCLYLINGFGCADTLCLPLLLESLQINVPTALAPEILTGSESNIFLPKAHSLREYRLRIYDRWGNVVFESIALDEEGKPTEAWDGKHYQSGVDLPMGAYTWRIDAVFNDGTVWRGKDYDRNQKTVGSVTLIR